MPAAGWVWSGLAALAVVTAGGAGVAAAPAVLPAPARAVWAHRLLDKIDQTKELVVSGFNLPISVLSSGASIAKEVLLKKQYLGGYPIFKEPEPRPRPVFQVVSEGPPGGDQSENVPEDPYQDISARAKGAAGATGAVGSAAGAVATRAALLKAFASPDALRTAKFGSNFVPGVNVFLLGAIKIVLGV